MKPLGLNSPEIFIILVVFLSILGPKRIEKGFLLFKKILKFLLSQDEKITLGNTELKENSILGLEEPEESEVKEETIEAELKLEEPEESEVKEETIEAEIKSNKPKKRAIKEETIEAEIKSNKPKKRAIKDEIKDVDINSDNK